MVARASVAIALATVAFLVSVAPAIAWDLGKSTNGVTINKEPSDTSTATVVVSLYWDYKGGASWVSSYTPSYTSSYNQNRWVCNLDGTDADAIEIDLQPGYRLQCVQVNQGSTYRKFAVINEALKVSRVDTAASPVYLSQVASIAGTVAVSSQPSTVSVAGTLPVDVVGAFGVPDFGSLVRLLAVALSATGGYSFAAYVGGSRGLV